MPDVASNANSSDFSVSVDTFDPASSQEDYPQILMQKHKEMLANLGITFQQNLQAFAEFEPELFAKIRSSKFTQQVQFSCTSNGVPNLFFLQKNKFLYSAFDPIEYCNCQVDVFLEHKQCYQSYYAEEKNDFGQIHFRYLNRLLQYQRENLPRHVTLGQTHACPCMFVLGVGLGYHIGRIYELVEVGTLLIVEPDPDLFYASLFTFDWANLLSFIHSEPNREIKFFVGLKAAQLKEDLQAFYADHRVLCDFFWSIRHYDSPEILESESVVSSLFNTVNRNMGFFDSRMFAFSQSVSNVLEQTPFLRKLKFRGKLPYKLLKLNHLTSRLTVPEQVLRIPVCVVANGPSLSDDLPFLRKIQDKVWIIACGTAYETLFNAGIQPDFYAALERIFHISEVLSLIQDESFFKNTILLSIDNIHPSVVKMFAHQLLLSKTDEPFYEMLQYRDPEQSYDLEPIYCVNPLVGNLGMAAAATIGFKQIYMFGVDNGSIREDKREHPEESILYGKIISDSRSDLAKEDQALNELNLEREGNFVKKVYTNYFYTSSVKTLEILIQNNNDLKFFNCSNGCKVQGATPIHSADLLEDWLKLPDVSVDLNEVLKQLTVKLPYTAKELASWCDKPLFNHVVLNCFKCLGIETDEVKNLPSTLPESNATQQEVDKLIANLQPLYDCDVPNVSSRLDVMHYLHQLQSYLKQLELDPRLNVCFSFLGGSLNNFCTLTMRSMYLSTDEESALKHARLHLKTLAFFLDDARRLYIQCLPEYYHVQHRNWLKGKIGFDHAGDPAPDVPQYKPKVSQQDRELYPNKIFVKRYE